MFFFMKGDSQPLRVNRTFNKNCSDRCLAESIVDGKLTCHCGEDTDIFDWTWQKSNATNVRISRGGKEVLFHPMYSSGTAIVTGQEPFKQNYHYYWEVKMISKLYGTDVMIGVGTSKLLVEEWQLKFCSLLGIDAESWGYSYQGFLQHNKLKRQYGMPFGFGSIIGVHLDMCTGTLEYFLNRIPLGIAFKNLKGKELYPMVSSTAAQSSIRITCSMSKEPSLQLFCLDRVMSYPAIYKEYKKIPGLSKLFEKQYFWVQPRLCKETEEKKRLAELDEDVTLSLVKEGYIVNKKMRTGRLMEYLDELVGIYDDCDIQDISSRNTDKEDAKGGPSTSSIVKKLIQSNDDSESESDYQEVSQVL